MNKMKKSAKKLVNAPLSEKESKQEYFSDILDNLASVRAKLKPLEKEEGRLKEILLSSGLFSFESDTYVGIKDVRPERRLNLVRLKDTLGANYIETEFYDDKERISIIVSKK